MKSLTPKSQTLTLTHFLCARLFSTSSLAASTHRLEDDDRAEAASRNVRVSVWWDFENCGIPLGVNVYRVAQSITAAVRANGIKGPVQITAFGDVWQLSRANQVALSATGINLTHIPGGDKNGADRSLLVDLMHWVSQNPPPAHLFLISGDKDFAGTLHRLRMNNYNILLASKHSPSSVLCSAASIMWSWNDLVRGENLAGRHFNHPPDGPIYSWYGQFKVPLEDPYAMTEPVGSSASNDSSDEFFSDSKVRPVPNAILKAIRDIVNTHPNGLSVSELRVALVNAHRQIDRSYYGYKKFSLFLSSMPEILKLQTQADGRSFVFAVSPGNAEPVGSQASVSKGSVSTLKTNGKVDSVSNAVNQNPPLINKQSLSSGSIIKDRIQKAKTSTTNNSDVSARQVAGNFEHVTSSLEVNEEMKEVKQDLSVQANHTDVGKGQDSPSKMLSRYELSNAQALENNVTAAKLGFFDRAWAWFRRDSEDRRIQLSDTLHQFHGSRSGFGESSPRDSESAGNSADFAHDSCSLGKAAGSPNAKSNTDTKTEGSKTLSQDHADESNASASFFAQVIGWCKFWKGKPNVNVMSEQSSAKLKIENIKKHEVFLTDSQWRDVKSFTKSYDASKIISNTRNREDLAQAMQKSGPRALQSLCLFDLLDLLDLLISEKKWIEECPSKTYPFRVILPNKNGVVPAHTHKTNDLSSMFLSSSSPLDSTKRSGHHEGRIVANLQHSEASSTINKKPAKKSRTEILADCQKLSEELLQANPEGFSIRTFRKLFIESYGYALDHEKLGYPKLRSLLQTIPGMQIVSTSVSPATVPEKDLSAQQSSPQGQTADPILNGSLKDDYNASWEELGPVEIPNDSNEEVKGACKVDDDYGSCLSNDDLTESEDEAFPSSKGEAEDKYRINEDKSSLLQILDAWHNSKDNSCTRDCRDNLEDTVDDSGHGLRPSALSQTGVRQGDIKAS